MTFFFLSSLDVAASTVYIHALYTAGYILSTARNIKKKFLLSQDLSRVTKNVTFSLHNIHTCTNTFSTVLSRRLIYCTMSNYSSYFAVRLQSYKRNDTIFIISGGKIRITNENLVSDVRSFLNVWLLTRHQTTVQCSFSFSK